MNTQPTMQAFANRYNIATAPDSEGRLFNPLKPLPPIAFPEIQTRQPTSAIAAESYLALRGRCQLRTKPRLQSHQC